MKVKTFIQSFSMESLDKQFMGVKLTDIMINTTINKISFYLFTPVNQSKIYSLTLSIIIFDTNSPGILYADGSI